MHDKVAAAVSPVALGDENVDRLGACPVGNEAEPFDLLEAAGAPVRRASERRRLAGAAPKTRAPQGFKGGCAVKNRFHGANVP